MLKFFEQLKVRLDAVHTWPSLYLFKFIVPLEKKTDLLGVLPTGLIEQKLSRTGKYVAVSLKVKITSSEQVIQVYEQASLIPGIISL